MAKNEQHRVEMRDDTALAKIVIDKENYPLADPLAAEVLKRLRAAAMHRSSTLCGPTTLSRVLKQCFNQRHGVRTAQDQEVIKAIGNDAFVNVTELKCSAAEAILKDNIIAPGGMPFYVEATPMPSMSESDEREAMRMALGELISRGEVTDESDIVEAAKVAKARMREKIKTLAEERAENMNRLLRDQVEEGGYREAMEDFLRDFVVYPYAVMEGPIYSFKEEDVWSGDKFTTKVVGSYSMRRVSPFDLYWSPDSTTTQDGTGVTVVERMSAHVIETMLGHESFDADQVKILLDGMEKGTVKPNWLLRNKEAVALHGNPMRVGGGTVEVLRHYGVFRGSDLKEWGVKPVRKGEKLEASKHYECTVLVVGGVTVQAKISAMTGQIKRPIHTASYERTGAGIAGVGLAQKLRDVERIYMSMLRALVANANFASKPITEIDLSRFPKEVQVGSQGSRKKEYEQMISLYPGKVLPVLGGNQIGDYSPAMRFYSIPSHMNDYARILQQIMELADRVTQIPAAMHGEPVGTGANRTFRGVAMLQGNALRTIANSVMNIDRGIHNPMGQILFRYNMLYHEGNEVKGDAKVIAKGATTMLEQEVKQQKIHEALALVGQTGLGTPELVSFLVTQLLTGIDIPESILQGLMPNDTLNAPPQEPNLSDETGDLQAAGVPTQGAVDVGGMIDSANVPMTE